MTRMKDSGIEWIGEVPEEWGITKFKYFLDTNKGLTITKDNLIEDGIPVINYGQIHSKYGRSVSTVRDELPQVSTNYLKFKQSLLNKGDFVFADTSEDIEGSGNFSTRIDDNGELFAGYHTIKAKLKNALEHDFRYFMHYFDSMAFRKQVQNKVSGIKVYSVTQSILQETCLILPSFIEQQQIADFLDKKVAQLDKVKSLLEEQIKTLEDYRQSLIYETVTKGLDKNVPLKESGIDWIGQIPEGWRTGKIKYYAEISAGSTPDRTNELFWNGDIPWMASGEVNQGVVTHTAEKITKLGLRNTSTKLLSKGTVMLALNGQGKTKGTAAILNIETASNQSLASFDVNNEVVNGYYLYYYFVANYSNIRGLKGEDRDGLNLKLVSNIEIPLPNIDEQLKIADFLDKKTEQINQMIAIKKEQIENINKQCQTLIYDYVTGKRRV